MLLPNTYSAGKAAHVDDCLRLLLVISGHHLAESARRVEIYPVRVVTREES